ncbi:MAG: CmcJ/NvfI family oxidoreductase [Alphaproteobacteria bacterium]
MSTAAALNEPLPETDVYAALTFIKRQKDKPYFKSSALTGGAPEVFFETEEHVVPVYDMREVAEDLSIEREGFELLRHVTAVEDLYDDDAVDNVYYPELQELLKRRFGASQVVIFDATRRSDGGAGAPNRDGQRGPATRVHVDYTVKSGPQRLRDVVGDEEAERLEKAGARIVQVNVWRPIKGPVQRSPLALADASSIPAEDLIATDQVFPDRVGEIYQLAMGEGHRWYYASQMTPDEVVLIKGWDSLDDGRARFAPHGAFELEGSENAPARESIEVRTLVIIE